ncbi:pilus assembly protein [Telluria mixta]|uniref:Pilus assembly protein n=1 Tax=Telluria mixta TaxID=34071 RepID=A0ABT2BZB7_9BURK|nr:TadE family protein [Telluria mixta]MCS0630492.1 pilus assembly protein [Telluria mixta]WEM94204.1 pilus assembly protein [Telluria mixta]
MRTIFVSPRRRTEQGSVTIEMAFSLTILTLFLAVPLFFAQVFWYYSVAQKAAHDAARFLSTASRLEMATLGTGDSDAPVSTLARQIALAETDEIRPMLDARTIVVQCDLTQCGWSVPQTVRVQVRIRISDKIFRGITDEFTNGQGINLTADSTMNYAGN